jgi:hypothetical protein
LFGALRIKYWGVVGDMYQAPANILVQEVFFALLFLKQLAGGSYVLCCWWVLVRVGGLHIHITLLCFNHVVWNSK